MTRSVISAAAIAALCASGGVVHAAEEEEAPAQQDPHAGHEMPSQQDDAHAGHEMPPMQHDRHAQQPSAAADRPTESELAHVPPDPPQHFMGDMSKERMIELMQMEDDAPFGMVLIDQLEWSEVDNADVVALDGQAWYGTDYNKLWLKVEGERVDSEAEARTELLWDRIFKRWWSVQAGVRHDWSEGTSRTWAAFGVQGLAPYWFEVEATAYVGEEGRTAARFSGEYELLLTQRLILQPEIEFNLYGKDDPENGIGSGFSDAEFALRLRYEFRREFAPYVGIVWTRAFGNTADIARAEGHDTDDLQFVAGLRAWF